MLKLLMVDDEPFITQGLSKLIDWEKEGYEIVKMADNGSEAYDYIKNNPVDLVISDIKMPIMNGLELLKAIREDGMKDVEVIILSGYKDFEYAKEGLKYGCAGYCLKPVDKIEITTLIREIAGKKQESREKEEHKKNLEMAYLARNVISLISGKFDEMNVVYIKENMNLSEEVNFVNIEFYDAFIEEEEEKEVRKNQRDLYQVCMDILGEDANHVIFDVSRDQDRYDIGLILCDYMYKDRKATVCDYLIWLHDELVSKLHFSIRLYVGKKVKGISNISKSYSTVRILKSFEGFRPRKDVYFYEDEVHVSNSGVVLCKQQIDDLISVIELNEKDKIKLKVTELYKEMRNLGVASETINLNMDYLLFQLIHLAASQDNEVNQEEVLQFISESSYSGGILRGSSEHLTSFSLEYADYLGQLRKNVPNGILGELEKEIQSNYMNNISLKELSKKFYVNTSYLGQIFKKKYGMSFKDYLTNCRINEAAVMLITTDYKIVQIAEKVGYKDSDYFIRKFIDIKGCTPSKYRKNKQA